MKIIIEGVTFEPSQSKDDLYHCINGQMSCFFDNVDWEGDHAFLQWGLQPTACIWFENPKAAMEALEELLSSSEK